MMRDPARAPSGSMFSSFWGAGFESACHINRAGFRLDMVAATEHDHRVDEDYARLRSMGITTVRESARWHLIDRPHRNCDFSTCEPMLRAAARHRLQVIWTLCHYGWPDGVDLLSASFVERFEGFCEEVAHFLREHGEDRPIFIPINEISFLAWAAGETGWFYPYLTDRGTEVKRQLVRAAIAGINAIRRVTPKARIVTSEPLIHVVADGPDTEQRDAAERYRDSQFEACDMLTGTLEPGLGGDPALVDAIGVNFYHDNQWQHPSGNKLGWHLIPRDQRWKPLHELLEEVFDRYRRPLCVTETSHVGEGRAAWLRDVSEQVGLAIDRGVPVIGVCLYPVIDRCDWDDTSHWHNNGLWDLGEEAGGGLARVLNRDYAEELLRAQRQTRQRQLAAPDHTCSREPDMHGQRALFEQEHDDAEQKSVCR